MLSPHIYILNLLLNILPLFPSIIPALCFLINANRHRNKNNAFICCCNIVASTTSILLPLYIVYEFTFHGTKGAQDSIIFGFLPFVAAILGGTSYFIVYFVGLGILKVIPLKSNLKGNQLTYTLLIPGFLIISYWVIASSAIHRGTILGIAASSTTPASDIRYLFRKAQENNDVGIFLFLAQNEKLPSDILKKLSKVPYSQVRSFVAGHPNTPLPIVERMTQDEEAFIRKLALKELKRRKETD